MVEKNSSQKVWDELKIDCASYNHTYHFCLINSGFCLTTSRSNRLVSFFPDFRSMSTEKDYANYGWMKRSSWDCRQLSHSSSKSQYYSSQPFGFECSTNRLKSYCFWSVGQLAIFSFYHQKYHRIHLKRAHLYH